MKTPNMIALVAAPAMLAAALIGTTGALTKSPTHLAAAAAPVSATAATTTTPDTATTPDAETADDSAGAAAASAAEPTTESTTESTTPENDAVGGHADNPALR